MGDFLAASACEGEDYQTGCNNCNGRDFVIHGLILARSELGEYGWGIKRIGSYSAWCGPYRTRALTIALLYKMRYIEDTS